jgi:hypothetical protein
MKGFKGVPSELREPRGPGEIDVPNEIAQMLDETNSLREGFARL